MIGNGRNMYGKMDKGKKRTLKQHGYNTVTAERRWQNKGTGWGCLTLET